MSKYILTPAGRKLLTENTNSMLDPHGDTPVEDRTFYRDHTGRYITRSEIKAAAGGKMPTRNRDEQRTVDQIRKRRLQADPPTTKFNVGDKVKTPYGHGEVVNIKNGPTPHITVQHDYLHPEHKGKWADADQPIPASKIEAHSMEDRGAMFAKADKEYRENILPTYKKEGISPELGRAIEAHVAKYDVYGINALERHHGHRQGNPVPWWNSASRKVYPLKQTWTRDHSVDEQPPKVV